jgi:hypothetical protein
MKLFRRDDLVTRLCRESGRWFITGREGDSYDLRSNDAAAIRFLSVRHRPDVDYVMFNAALPLRFPLDRTPSGLFARMLLRNVGLKYCHWNMDLRGSLEAVAYLHAQWPILGMTAGFFDSLCREMTEEIRGFHQELRDKFQGDMTRPAASTPGPAAAGPDVRFVEPVQQSRTAGSVHEQLMQHGLGRMLGHNGKKSGT